jgi:hypothetical protein
MIPVWIKFYRSIKQLLESLVNLSIVFACCNIMIILPILNQLQMFLHLYRLFQWLSHIIIHSRSRF